MSPTERDGDWLGKLISDNEKLTDDARVKIIAIAQGAVNSAEATNDADA